MVTESLGLATAAGAVSGAAGGLGAEIPVAANFTAAGAATFAFGGTAAAAAGRCLDKTFALPFPIPAARQPDRLAAASSIPGSAAGELQAATVAA
ncbi:hypothetical protein [Mesorhizobium sp. L48C026A00]|uniref:hypothetical protein n=1 Tax=Mesorhizobium sp. L48C026A00 TaxID=1287182 RepID=UPI0018DEAE88|nr:hypothetical protein [Mesorhizobium sp. L48C026A00]